MRKLYTSLRIESLERRELLTTLHVDLSDADCDATGPVFCEIQQAVDAAKEGDRITVAAGRYRPVSGTLESVTIVEATPDADPVIDGTSQFSAYGFELNGSGMVIQGFHLIGTKGILTFGDDNKYVDNVIDGTGNSEAAGIIVHGERNEYRGNDVSNVFTGFWVPGCNYKVTGNSAHKSHFGFFVTGCESEISDNTAYENVAYGFAIGGRDNVAAGNHSFDNGQEGFLTTDEFGGVPVVGNVFRGNTATGNGLYGFHSLGEIGGFVFEGNECRHNDPDGDNYQGAMCLVVTVDHVFGDSNGDGIFDSADLVLALAAGTYETGQSATYAQGDWNDDGLFDSSDLVDAMQSGNYVSQ